MRRQFLLRARLGGGTAVPPDKKQKSLTREGFEPPPSDAFITCSPIQAGAPLDLATFFWFGITETFAYLVQYATPGDIPDACAVLTDSSVSDPVQRLATWVRSQEWTQPCIETRYSVVVAEHTNTSYDSPQAVMQ
ncbi:uncharacterized protein [Choristoneura fumiferana]|uniref:uncharacterized protein n=1 Tax=Choristoneura fumiferana TaxID=7141 RepID=UPI003D155F91